MGKSIFTMTVTGPFFKSDPAKTFRQNAREMLAAIAEEAAADIQTQMRIGESRRAEIHVGGGHVSDRVVGYSISTRTGRPWAATSAVRVNVVGATKAGAVSIHSAAKVVESRVHAFRKTTTYMRHAKALNRAELLKGLQ